MRRKRQGIQLRGLSQEKAEYEQEELDRENQADWLIRKKGWAYTLIHSFRRLFGYSIRITGSPQTRRTEENSF